MIAARCPHGFPATRTPADRGDGWVFDVPSPACVLCARSEGGGVGTPYKPYEYVPLPPPSIAVPEPAAEPDGNCLRCGGIIEPGDYTVAVAGSSEYWRPPEAVTLVDFGITTGTTQTNMVMTQDGAVRNGTVLNFVHHVSTIATRPALRIGFPAGSLIGAKTI